MKLYEKEEFLRKENIDNVQYIIAITKNDDECGKLLGLLQRIIEDSDTLIDTCLDEDYEEETKEQIRNAIKLFNSINSVTQTFDEVYDEDDIV